MIAGLAEAVAENGMFLAGALHEDGNTLVLLMADTTFWPILQAAPEFGQPDPVDRYSTRVITQLADRFGAMAEFPFGGPPYAPFLRWAVASSRAWSSPVGMLVHDTAGLMISYRGALRFQAFLPLPPTRDASPCKTCMDKPCLGACPVGALGSPQGYDVSACHEFLDTPPGASCMDHGCRVRRACPVSQVFGRDPAQSAHHMKAFHP